MQVVPLDPVPSQTVTVALDGQDCSIRVYQKYSGLFLDLYVAGSLIIGGVICQDANRIVRDAYLGFDGDLAFFDNTGSGDPEYTGVGSRYLLVYLTDEDLEAAGIS